MLNIKRTVAGIALAVATLWGTYTVGHVIGIKDERLAQQEVIKNEYIKKTTADIQQHNAVQTALDAIAKRHSDEMAELEGSTDGIVNALNADNKRLRIKLKAVSGAPGDKQQCISTVDGKAELDEGDAKRLIGIAQKGDKWIENLQDTVRVLQGKLKEKETK